MGPKAKRWRGAKGLGLGEQRSTGGRGGEGEGGPGGSGGAVPGEEEVRLILDVGRGLGRVIPKGPTALPAAAVEWCGGREERGSHPALTPPLGWSRCRLPLPQHTRLARRPHPTRGTRRTVPLLSPGGSQPHEDLAQEGGAAKLKLQQKGHLGGRGHGVMADSSSGAATEEQEPWCPLP